MLNTSDADVFRDRSCSRCNFGRTTKGRKGDGLGPQTLSVNEALITTALATGGYIAFLANSAAPSDSVAVGTALATVGIFFVLHSWGVKEQSTVMVWMTYGAILGLVIFWILASTSFRFERVWTTPLLPTYSPLR